MSLVEVRPIERETWHGKKGKESFARPVVVEALVNVNTLQYSLDLSEERKEELQKLTGYDLNTNYIVGQIHPFFSSAPARVKLGNETVIFDTRKPLDEIKVAILKGSDLVANSLEEYNQGKFPEARFIIYDEKEEIEVKASKAAIKRTAIIESTKLTAARKVEIVQILLEVGVKHQSTDFIDLKLDEAIEQDAERVLSLIRQDKNRISMHALVLEGLQKNILRKEGASIYYLDDQLGFDLESTIEYFEDKKNQALKAQILEKINS